MVHIKALLQTSSQTFSNTSSALQISGLPYTPGNAVETFRRSLFCCRTHQQLLTMFQSVDGDYINTGLSGGNVVFQITKKGGNRGQIRNLGWGPSGTSGYTDCWSSRFTITQFTMLYVSIINNTPKPVSFGERPNGTLQNALNLKKKFFPTKPFKYVPLLWSKKMVLD